jgi:3-oxoadipate enol-lactonase
MKAIINNCLHRYIDVGISSALPVIFIHGFPFSHKMWTMPGGVTEALSSTHRVIAYDIRGHGESEIGSGQFTIELFVDDFFCLLDHLKIHKAIVVGLSMGGYIALRAIERSPERFYGLVLCDTRSESDPNESKIKRANAITSLFAAGIRTYAEDYVKNVFAPDSLQNKSDAVKIIQSIIERTSPTAIAGTLIALSARTDTTNSLSLIHCPTLILVGENDAVTPVAASQSMKEKIPQAQLVIVPNAGHMSNLENPEFFNKQIVEFVSAIK